MKGKKCLPGCKCFRHSIEQREKLSKAHKDKPKSPEQRVKMSASHTGKTQTPEHRFHNSEAQKKRVDSEETTEKHRRDIRIAKQFYHKSNESEKALQILLSNMYWPDMCIPQFPIGNYFVDCAIPSLSLVFEADESYHKKQYIRAYDAIRQHQIEIMGYEVIRFTKEELLRWV